MNHLLNVVYISMLRCTSLLEVDKLAIFSDFRDVFSSLNTHTRLVPKLACD